MENGFQFVASLGTIICATGQLLTQTLQAVSDPMPGEFVINTAKAKVSVWCTSWRTPYLPMSRCLGWRFFTLPASTQCHGPTRSVNEHAPYACQSMCVDGMVACHGTSASPKLPVSRSPCEWCANDTLSQGVRRSNFKSK